MLYLLKLIFLTEILKNEFNNKEKLIEIIMSEIEEIRFILLLVSSKCSFPITNVKIRTLN